MKNYILLLVTILSINSTFAQNWWNGSVTGKGPLVTQTLDLKTIKGITQSTSGQVIITQGNTQSVEVTGQANIIEQLNRNVVNGHWNIKFDGRVRNMKELTVRITVRDLNAVRVSGSGSIHAKNMFKDLDEVEVSVSGSGRIDLPLEANDVSCRISGSGDIKLEGQGRSQSIRISGSGDVHNKNFEVENTDIRISGSGDVRVFATENLDISVSGSGDVYFRGSPRVKSRVSGSGDVRSID